MGNVFVSESICFKNHQLAYKFQTLKYLGKSIQPESVTMRSTYSVWKVAELIKYLIL